MSHVGLPKFDGFRIRLDVIVAIRQAEPALVQLRDNLGGILEVLVGLEVKQNAPVGHAGSNCGKIPLGMHFVDSLQVRLQWRYSRSFNRLFVHAGRIVIADLLFDRILRLRRARSAFQDFAQEYFVVIR